MKRVTILMLGIITITSFSFAQNFVTNPGFEDVDPTTYTVLAAGQHELMRVGQFWDGTTQTTNPTSSAVDISAGGTWVRRSPSTGYIKSRVIDTDGHSGANCLHMYHSAGSSQTGMQNWYNIASTQRLTTALNNSKVYKASVWAKVDATVGNVCDKIVFGLTDNVKRANITFVVTLTGGTAWTKYDVTFDIPGHIAKVGNETADFSLAFFSVGISTTYDASNLTNYSGVLLDDYSLIVDTSTSSLNNIHQIQNVLSVKNHYISSTQSGKLEVFNVSGSKLFSKDIDAGEDMHLPAGFYVIKLTSGGDTYIQKALL